MTRQYAKELPIADIRRDGGTQIRAALDEDSVSAYAEAIKEGAKLPPVTVYYDLTDYWLSDGFHRIDGALRAAKKKIAVEVRTGSQRDALLAACGSNADHGLRRSNADKRRAVETLLADPEWSQWSDRAIAKATQVDHGTVAAVRAELAKSPRETERVKDSTSGKPTPLQPPGGNPTVEGEKGAGASVRPEQDPPPAPDEPIPYTVVVTRDRLVNVERMLRDAQAEIAPLLTRGEALAVQVALVDALTIVRAALNPPVLREAGKGWPEPRRPVPASRRLQIMDDAGRELVIERDEDGAEFR